MVATCRTLSSAFIFLRVQFYLPAGGHHAYSLVLRLYAIATNMVTICNVKVPWKVHNYVITPTYLHVHHAWITCTCTYYVGSIRYIKRYTVYMYRLSTYMYRLGHNRSLRTAA